MPSTSALRRTIAVIGVSAVSLVGVTLSAAPAQAATHAAHTRVVANHAHPFGHGPRPGTVHRAHPFGHGPRPNVAHRAHPRMHGLTH